MAAARSAFGRGERRFGRRAVAPLAAVVAAAVSLVARSVAATPILTAGPGEFNSSEQCGECHRDISAAWKESQHAQALQDPLFIDALRDLSAENGDVKVCLKCHAPTTQWSHDAKLEKKITWEGITCDYCHSTTAVSQDASPKLTLVVGGTKFGPIRDAVSSAHKTEYRELFKGSAMCASCHEYVSPSGLAVLTTYSDWKASPQAAQGQTCQSCHMSEVKANVVDPRVKRLTNATVNLHTMAGGHSISQLNRALIVHADVARKGETVELDMDIANRGAGHTVPAGSAARQVILEVRVDTNQGQQVQDSRVYERVLTDAAGTPLFRDRDLFARAVGVKSDTRLKAGETRHEHFTFKVGSKALANIKLQLVYRHTPGPNQEPPVKQIFLTRSWTLPPV